MHRRSIVLSWGLLAAVAVGATAQERRPMTVVDLLNVPQLSDPQLSPDGQQLLYVLAEADWDANSRVSHVWRVDVDGSDAVQLTTGTEGERSPRWSPDGRRIALLTKRGQDAAEQIYLLANGGGEATRLTDHPTEVSNIEWASDGSALYFLASDAKSGEQRARLEAQDDVYAFEENYDQRHLWMVSASDGGTRRITEGDFSVRGFRLSSDGTQVVLRRAPAPILEVGDQSEVWIMNTDGEQARRLTDNGIAEGGGELSPDGSQVLFLARASRDFEKYYNGNLFVIPVGGGAARELVPELGYSIDRAAWSSDGQSVFFVANMGVHDELFAVDVTSGAIRQLTDGEHSIGAWSLAVEADHHVLTLDQPTNPGDVWVMANDDGGTPRRVTHVFEHLAEEFELPRQELTSWAGADGVAVEGVLYYPLGYQEGQRYPLVVQTHGGPQSADQFGFGRWSSYVQVLTAKGYVVLKPNYRGSTGYGDPFLRDMVGHYFQNAHLDVMAGVDHLIAMGLVDGDRMAKMGWSAGGHMMNKIITYTDRFKAASSGAGAANWISMYAQSDTRSQRTPWFGGTPWQADAPTDVCWEQSPLRHVASVTTPTLFLVGAEDERVPLPQSVEMYRALKSHGVPTHLYIAPREPHGWRELRHELFKVNVELDWFERYVTERPYTWETPPDQAAQARPGTSMP